MISRRSWRGWSGSRRRRVQDGWRVFY
jgi:hypothetical protein